MQIYRLRHSDALPDSAEIYFASWAQVLRASGRSRVLGAPVRLPARSDRRPLRPLVAGCCVGRVAHYQSKLRWLPFLDATAPCVIEMITRLVGQVMPGTLRSPAQVSCDQAFPSTQSISCIRLSWRVFVNQMDRTGT